MSRRLISIAAPIGLSLLAPGLGTALGAGLGATGATAGVLGNSLLGAGIGAATGGGLRGALMGAAGGGLGSAIGGSGVLGRAAGTPMSGGLQGATQGSGLLGAATRMTAPLTGAMGGGTSSFGNVASNIFSGLNTSSAQNKARKQLLEGQGAALSQLQPYNQTGQQANASLARLLGISEGSNPEDVTAALRNTPGYQFQLEQGTQAADRANAARGGFFSGAALREAQQFGQGLADQTYNQRINDLQQQSAQGLNAAGGVGSIYGAMGDTRANATVAKSNALNQSLAGIMNPQQEIEFDPATGKYKLRGA